MKKIISVSIIFLALVLLLTGCSNNVSVERYNELASERDDLKSQVNELEKEVSSLETDRSNLLDYIKYKSSSSSAESKEQKKEIKELICDEQGFKIYYTGLSQEMDKININLLIENHTDTDYVVQVRDFSINGYMVDATISCDVTAQKKANDEIYIYSEELNKNGITTMEQAIFKFHLFKSDNLGSGSNTKSVTINFK